MLIAFFLKWHDLTRSIFDFLRKILDKKLLLSFLSIFFAHKIGFYWTIGLILSHANLFGQSKTLIIQFYQSEYPFNICIDLYIYIYIYI